MKTILFDLDGTLTDSGEGIMNCARVAYKHFGLTPPDDMILRTFVGPPLRNSFANNGIPEENVEEAMKVFRARYQAVGKFENTPYPGIRQLLEKLQQEGHFLCVATSKPEVTAVEILEKFDLAKYFRFICGATMDKSRDSKSAVIAYLLEQAGGAENAVMVGDTEFDVLGAKQHGIPTIGVTWGYGNKEETQKAGAIAMANTVEELYNLLSK